MPQGGRLTIETTNVHLDDAYVQAQGGDVKAGQYMAIVVTDTGTGMTPDVIAQAFDPFFTTKPPGHGTGLELSMLYGFIKQSEGHVRIYSEVGRGTTFKIYLPRYRESLPTASEAAELNSSEEVNALERETVLVIDDEAAIRMLVVETLRDLGYRTVEAAESKEALGFLESAVRIDLLVTDVGLPGLNGRQNR